MRNSGLAAQAPAEQDQGHRGPIRSLIELRAPEAAADAIVTQKRSGLPDRARHTTSIAGRATAPRVGRLSVMGRRRIKLLAGLFLFVIAFVAWASSLSDHRLTPHSVIFLSAWVAMLTLVALTVIFSIQESPRG